MDKTAGELLVLLVEDNADDEMLTLRALSRTPANPRVTVVRDGREAMAYVASANQVPDLVPVLVLLDLKLPFANGFEVLKAIREGEATRQVPVVVVTSSDEQADVERANDLGADDYLRKPVDFKEYLARVESVARMWLPASPAPA